MEYQTSIYTQDSVTKSITLSVLESGGSEKTSTDNAFDAFKCLRLDANEILKIETKGI